MASLIRIARTHRAVLTHTRARYFASEVPQDDTPVLHPKNVGKKTAKHNNDISTPDTEVDTRSTSALEGIPEPQANETSEDTVSYEEAYPDAEKKPGVHPLYNVVIDSENHGLAAFFRQLLQTNVTPPRYERITVEESGTDRGRSGG